MSCLLFSTFSLWIKLLSRRNTIPCVVLVIASISLVYVYLYTQSNSFLETKDNPHSLDDVLVNKTWLEVRNVLLGEQKVSKVIILAHARGGSTLCSDVFNIEPSNTVLWYEALHGFHSFYSGLPHDNTDTAILYYKNLTRRPANNGIRNELAKYLTQLMTCDFNNVPVELIAMSPFMRKSEVFNEVVVCTEQMNTFNRFKDCQEIIRKYCFYEELMAFSTDDPIVSSFKCAELLKSIRRLKWKRRNRVTINELLRSYFSDQNVNKSVLENTVYSLCPQFSDLSGEEQLTLKGGSHSSWPCLNLATKLNLFIKHDKCLENLYRDTLDCRQKMAAPCRRTRLTVAEFQRVFIEDLEPFMQQMPDIHIVHYVRDPRAVSFSRAEIHLHTFRARASWTAMHEAYLLCQRMLYDIEHKKRLQQIYPGSIITVRYEDLVLDPEETVKRMYEFFGRPVPRGLNAWVKSTMQAGRDNGMYGVQRSNGMQQLSKWRLKVNADDLDIMNQHCLDVLNEYDYKL